MLHHAHAVFLYIFMIGYIIKASEQKGTADRNEQSWNKNRGKKKICWNDTDRIRRENVCHTTDRQPLENGTVLPDIDKIAEIAYILGVSCDYLVTYSRHLSCR